MVIIFHFRENDCKNFTFTYPTRLSSGCTQRNKRRSDPGLGSYHSGQGIRTIIALAFITLITDYFVTCVEVYNIKSYFH